MIMNCSEHGAMLNYGTHGNITIYRCERVWGTHKEIWLHKNGNQIDVKPHTYLKSKEGREIESLLQEG